MAEGRWSPLRAWWWKRCTADGQKLRMVEQMELYVCDSCGRHYTPREVLTS